MSETALNKAETKVLCEAVDFLNQIAATTDDLGLSVAAKSHADAVRTVVTMKGHYDG